MSQQDTYFIFTINYDVDDIWFTEHYVIQAEDKFEAEIGRAHV